MRHAIGAGRSPARAESVGGLRGCLSCGQIQIGEPPADLLVCARCDAPLERAAWRSEQAACAFAVATLLLLLPAATLPLMHTALLGASRAASVPACIRAMLDDGAPELAAMLVLCVLALPLARFGLLAATLGALRLGRRPDWLGRAFRHATGLQPWAMTDVFAVGFLIAFLRLRSTIDVEIGTGGLCLVASGILALFTRATINEAAIWRAILPDAIAPDATAPGAPAPDATAGAMLACACCARIAPAADAGRPCLRCGATLRRREPYAVVRGAALIVAGALLYLPANLYPIATLPIGARSIHYTVLEGVIDLAQAKLLGLALIVLTASFVIPILKLAAMAWCLASILHRSPRNLGRKARAFRFVEEIGRWSMVDPFVIACFVPVATFNAVIYARAEAAAPFFTVVVILTMIAARRFDPRLLWDAAAKRA